MGKHWLYESAVKTLHVANGLRVALTAAVPELRHMRKYYFSKGFFFTYILIGK